MKTLNALSRGFVLLLSLPLLIYGQAPTPGGVGGWSMPTNKLASWTFQDTTDWTSDQGYAPLSLTNIALSYMGNIDKSYSMLLDNTDPAWLRYNVVEANGATNLTVDAGTVGLWFSPDWASASTNQNGTGPGTWGRLLEVGSYTADSSIGWWALYFDCEGANIYFSAQTNSGDGAFTNYISAPIDWNYGGWHFIALSYSTSNSALYLDGKFAASGPGVSVYPGADVLTNGFSIGSDSAGYSQASGVFDDIYSYNYPLDGDAITNMYSSLYTGYIINPFNLHPIYSAPLGHTPPSGSTSNYFYVLSGPGNLQWQSYVGSCFTSSNVWFTNMSGSIVSGLQNFTFGVTGGSNGLSYDVFATTALQGPATNGVWNWMGQANACSTYTLSGLPPTAVFFMLGKPIDSDGDGLSDAFELLVSHTNPGTNDTDGDGINDFMEWIQGSNPFNGTGLTSDTNNAAKLSIYTPLE